jgi:hypothetical protein
MVRSEQDFDDMTEDEEAVARFLRRKGFDHLTDVDTLRP